MLVKVRCPPGPTRTEVIQLCDIFRARVVDVGEKTLTLCVTGDSGKVGAGLALGGCTPRLCFWFIFSLSGRAKGLGCSCWVLGGWCWMLAGSWELGGLIRHTRLHACCTCISPHPQRRSPPPAGDGLCYTH